MTVVLVVIASVILVLGLAVLVRTVRDEIVDDIRRERIAAEVARATSRLRRLESDALREMHKASEELIDVEGEEK